MANNNATFNPISTPMNMQSFCAQNGCTYSGEASPYNINTDMISDQFSQTPTNQTAVSQLPMTSDNIMNNLNTIPMNNLSTVPMTNNSNVVIPDTQAPETLTNPVYTPGFLSANIGKWMRVEFLVGNSISDRVGRLIEVGASYIVLQPLEGNTSIMCDLFAIKFVTIINNFNMACVLNQTSNM